MKALAVILALWAGASDAACRQALALGLDVSGSVDATEYRLQLDGLAAALERPDVVAAFLDMPAAPVRLSIFEWSGQGGQRVLQPWAEVLVSEDLAAVAMQLRASRRVPMDLSTALGEAKRFGATLLAGQGECWRHVLDLSGDGISNTGPRPQDVVPNGVLVNGLVIGDGSQGADGIGKLVSYFRAYVIEGPGAFVETATGFDAFEDAMARKLIRELQTVVVSQRQADAGDGQ